MTSGIERYAMGRRLAHGIIVVLFVLAFIVLGRLWSAPAEPTRAQRVLKTLDLFGRRDDDGYWRGRALTAVAALKRDDGPCLVDAYLDAEPALRSRLGEALAEYPYIKEYLHRLVPLLDSDDVELARDVLHLLVSAARSRLFLSYVVSPASEFGGSVLQRAFQRADGALGADAVILARQAPSATALTVLDSAYRSGDAHLREAAVRALGRYDAFVDRLEVDDILRDALESGRKGLVMAALGSIEELAYEELVDAAVDLAGSEDPDLRLGAVRALHAIGGAVAGARLRSALSDSSADVRTVAARACGVLGDQEAVHGLRKMLAGDLPQDRGMAALALADLKDTSSVPQIETLLEDPHGRVRLAAWEALRRLTGKDYPLESPDDGGGEKGLQ